MPSCKSTVPDSIRVAFSWETTLQRREEGSRCSRSVVDSKLQVPEEIRSRDLQHFLRDTNNVPDILYNVILLNSHISLSKVSSIFFFIDVVLGSGGQRGE